MADELSAPLGRRKRKAPRIGVDIGRARLPLARIGFSVIALVLAAALGLTTAIRRISVYRAKRASDRVGLTSLTVPDAGGGHSSRLAAEGPPERNFPLTVVITHGLFAVTTLTLVLLTALGAGGR